jgi:PEGA domain
MDSPVDPFSSESSPHAPPRRVVSSPRDARPHVNNTRGTTLVNRLRRRAIHAVDWVAERTVTVPLLVRAARRWMVAARWREGRIHRPAWASNERLAVIATAAVTSAAVSQFTLWMASDRSPRADSALVVSGSAVDGSEPPAVAIELPADRTLPRLAETTSTPTSNTPLPSLPETFAYDNAASQDAMLLQDRPVLMDSRMLMGTTGSASHRPLPIASLAPDRNPAVGAIGPRAKDGNSVVAGPAAPPAGLVVITQPEGARVTINGVGWGVTPLTIGHLPPGAKRVRITKPGYGSEERLVATDPERPAATLRIAMRRVANKRKPD